MEAILLGIIMLVSLFMIPLGLPGTWVMIAAGVGYSILVPNSIGMFALIGTVALAVVAEVFEFTLAGKYARKYGGSKRASWGAVIGGTVGAFVGVPVPIIGPILGAFAGAFLGALVFEYSRGSGAHASTKVATGALIGRVVASALKVAIGLMIAAWLVSAAVF
ncbi:MAG TPA: DUF456 domain-containing protein [Gemmatimonadaceae bacterium]|nr:DUF456 domain-containing protein [Gemmatimonadaceae bacterium]